MYAAAIIAVIARWSKPDPAVFLEGIDVGLGFVKSQPSTDTNADIKPGFVGVEVHLIVSDRPPEALDEDVAAPLSLSV